MYDYSLYYQERRIAKRRPGEKLFPNNSHWVLKKFNSQVAGSQNDESMCNVMLDSVIWNLCNMSASSMRTVAKGSL